jgi:hypothetical protein
MMKPFKSYALILFTIIASALYAAPVELVDGKFKLVLYPDSGSFSLYQLLDVGKNRYEPLFEDRNCSATSWFSVESDGRVFRLGSRLGNPVSFEQTESGATYVFNLTEDFQATQVFSFLKDSVSSPAYAVRVETTVQNTSGKDSRLAIKALLDTTLGENEGIHFFTDLRNRISVETRYDRTANLDSVIVSRDKNASLMIYLDGNGATKPEYVYVANWSRLNTLTWQPDFVEGRSFNTMYAINDSALLFQWKEQEVLAGGTISASMVMGSYDPARVKSKAGDEAIVMAAGTDISKRAQLIQQLIARIDELEANPDSATDEELKQLNATLDILLKEGKE